MVQTTLPESGVEVQQSTTDPENIGDLVIVSGSGVVLVDNCDSIATWATVSGSPTITLNTTSMAEGTGCVRVAIPKSSSVIVKTTVAAKDLSASDYLKAYLYMNSHINAVSLYFGEAAYDEQTYVVGVPDASWKIHAWDISDIAAASRNGVTIFAVGATNTNTLFSRYLYIDYVWAAGANEEFKTRISSGPISLYWRNKIVTGNTLLRYASAPTERNTASVTPVKLKEVEIKREGTYQVIYDGYHTSTGGGSNVYKNGVAYGTEQALTGGYLTYTEDLAFVEGDLCQIYAWRTGGAGAAYVRNFYIDGNPDVADVVTD